MFQLGNGTSTGSEFRYHRSVEKCMNMLDVLMGNNASTSAAALANAVLGKISQVRRVPAIVRVQQQPASTAEFDHNDHDQPADSAAGGGTSASSTFGNEVKSKDVFCNRRALVTCPVVHPMPAEPDLLTSSSPKAAFRSLHAFTQTLKKTTEFIKDSVYELVREDHPDVEFVFFHGLQPDPEDIIHAFWRTWRMRFTEECWLSSLLPKLLNYAVLAREIKPRVLSVSYESASKLGFWSCMAAPIDQFSFSENLMMDMIATGRRAVGQGHHVPVILVGHDLGGIMIKHLLMKVKKRLAGENLALELKRNLKYFWESLSALVFFATPQVGYPTIDDMIPPNSSTPSLQFLSALNKDTARVNKEFETFLKFKDPEYQIPTLRIWESAKTNQGRYNNEFVVPRQIRDNSDCTALWEDHFQVCQPTGLHSFTARRFARFVVQLVEMLREDDHFV